MLDTQAGFQEIKGSAEKINTWIERGAEVEFVSGVSKFAEVKKMNDKLKELGLSDLKIHAKHEADKLMDLVEEVKPRIFILNEASAKGEKPIAEQAQKEDFKVTVVMLEPKIGLEVLPEEMEDLKLYGQDILTSEEE